MNRFKNGLYILIFLINTLIYNLLELNYCFREKYFYKMSMGFEMNYFNIADGFPEAVVRALRKSFLLDEHY